MNQAESINIDLPRLMTVEPLETADTFVGQSESYGLLGIYGGHFIVSEFRFVDLFAAEGISGAFKDGLS